jgi:hypothetical protein
MNRACFNKKHNRSRFLSGELNAVKLVPIHRDELHPTFKTILTDEKEDAALC